MNKINVLFVCLGNICRSPMAEGIFRGIVEKNNLQEHFHIDSSGTSRYHIGKCPDVRAIQTCKEKNIVLDHLGQEFIAEDFMNQDYIVAMDASNLSNIKSLMSATKIRAEIVLMRDFDLQHKGEDVPDPYYGGNEGFYEVFDMLERSSYELLHYIRSKHSI